MSGFQHDTLIVLVQHINPRTEKHGEEDQLAVDVKCWLAPGESGEQWSSVLADLVKLDDADPSEWVQEVSGVLDILPFAQHFEDHTCTFWAGSKKIAGLTHAKLNKFRMEFSDDKHDDRILFRIQAETDGKTVGALSEFIGQKIRLEVTKPQGELDLEDEAA